MNGCIFLKINGVIKPFLGVGYDLEGTTVDLNPLHEKAHRAIAELLGINLPDDVDEVIKLIPSFVGGPDKDVMEQIWNLAKQRGVSTEKLEEWTVDRMLEYKDALFDGFFENEKFGPRKDVTSSMFMFETLGVKYGICSVTRALQAEKIIDRSGLRSMFSGRPVVLRPHVQHPKPNPDVYLKIAEDFGINPSQLLVFEDSLPGVLAGIRAGATVFAVPATYAHEDKSSDFRKKQLTDAGAVVFNNWREVSTFLRENSYVYQEGVINMDNKLNVWVNGELDGSLVKAFGGQSILETDEWHVGYPDNGMRHHTNLEN